MPGYIPRLPRLIGTVHDDDDEVAAEPAGHISPHAVAILPSYGKSGFRLDLGC